MQQQPEPMIQGALPLPHEYVVGEDDDDDDDDDNNDDDDDNDYNDDDDNNIPHNE